MGLYENVKNAAKMRNISINQIEKDLGFPRSSIAKFNSNVPSSDKIFAIAKYLDVSMEYLMTGEAPERSSTGISNIDDEAMEIFRLYKKLNSDAQKIVKGILKSNQ